MRRCIVLEPSELRSRIPLIRSHLLCVMLLDAFFTRSDSWRSEARETVSPVGQTNQSRSPIVRNGERRSHIPRDAHTSTCESRYR